jgi:adenylate cyclase
MKRKHQQYLNSLILQMLGWVGALFLFYLVRFPGLEALQAFRDVDLSGLDYRFFIQICILAGVAMGLAYGILDLLLDRPRLRQMPYGVLILTQTVFHLTLLIVVIGVVRWIELWRTDQGFGMGLWLSTTFNINTLILLAYTGVVSFTFNFLKQVNRKFGPGNLMRLLMGKYYHPREETRIFMFLDLKSSTSHAERLGHIRYSQLIQDCFRDLAVVIANRAEVYQYVGDEAVLCWEERIGLEDLNCLHAFFRFHDRLQERSAHYQANYGFVPEFKAGLNIGAVTAVEVGEIKKEIAFHGDVLNTAARIQAYCNEYQASMLISEYLRDALPHHQGFEMEDIGHLELRGRTRSLNAFAVRPAKT